MQYLGEYLAPVNSIALDSDTLTKYFYFRPDMYDNPDADLENIFIIKNMPEFPKRYDLLSENNLYAVDTIEVNKKVTEEEGDSNKRVSYVVVASYDLLENIRSRENQNSGGDSADADAEVNVDKNGSLVTKETLPWELQPEWSFDHKSTTVPFLFGYDLTGKPTIPVVNSAGSKLLSETEKYQLQITYKDNYQQLNRTLTAIMQPVVNSDIVTSEKLGATFPSGTLLMYPPTFSNAYATYQVPKLDEEGNQMYDDEGNELAEEKTKQYWKYQVNMVYSPKGWNKELMNIGTQAIFTKGQGREQIYHLKELDTEGNLNITGRYTNLADVLKVQSEANKKGLTVAYEMVTEPLPLTAEGMIDTAAITSQKYSTLTFKQYPSIPFSDLIAWNLTVDELDNPY